MTRTLMRTQLTRDQNGRPVKLEYYLRTEERCGLEQYGVEIVMERGRQKEACAVNCITPLAASISRIIEILANGTVTPGSLREMLMELL